LEYEAAVQWAGTDDILFLVYGGGKQIIKSLQNRLNFVHLLDRNERVTAQWEEQL
jgi:hypothetical protein